MTAGPCHLVEILLPKQSGNGEPVGKEWFEGLLQELTDKFGGATSFVRSPGKGLWQSGGLTESDTIAVIDPDYWRSLRKRRERELAQEEIIIRAHEIRRL